jgi:hypothetical protein
MKLKAHYVYLLVLLLMTLFKHISSIIIVNISVLLLLHFSNISGIN